MMKEEFVKAYYKHAKRAELKAGVPALFALAQSALETGWGKHTPNNMMFGIKVGSGKNYGGWTGDKQLISTTEYSKKATLSFPYIFPNYPVKNSSGKWKYRVKDYFRSYPSPFNSFVDWSGLLTRNSRYRFAMQHRKNVNRFAEEVARAGYATDPNYANKIKAIMGEIAQVIKVNKLEVKSIKKAIIPIFLSLIGLSTVVYSIVRTKNE